MNIKMHELAAVDACKQKRSFSYQLQTSAEMHMKKAGAIKDAIRSVLFGKMKKEDIEEFLKIEFQDIPYASERQRAAHVHDAYRQVARYIGSETRALTVARSRDIDLGGGLTVTVNPDFIFRGEGRLEVIKIKTSKPTLTCQGAWKDLGLYAMIKYAREELDPEEEALITASYYFLRKANDSSSMDEPNFDEDFFNTTGGRNIVNISEKYVNDGMGTPTAIDEDFRPLVEKYVAGLEADECTDDDCRHCELYDICKFTDPPLAIEKEAVIRSLKDLNLTKAQEEVVEYEKGICRVNAGAGAGKTMVIALRTATLINKGVKPEEILLITFTNAGAEEMRSRIALILEDFGVDADVSRMHILTFNAFGDEILKKEYLNLGFTAEPKVIDDVERSRIIADLLNEHEIDGLDYRNFETNMKTCMGALGIAKLVFSIVKIEQYSAGDYMEVKEKMGNKARFASINAIKELIQLYDRYDDRLRSDNLIEFADQEVLVFEILHKDPFYLERFGFKHIIVDEFQDSNEGQIRLIKMLRDCPSCESLMVVGDDAQAIFGFRNTSPRYILDFEEIMGEKIDDIALVENHRSTPEILDAANKINATRQVRIDKDLVATRKNGANVIVEGFLTKKEEKDYVVTEIGARIEDGMPPEDIAVICATKYELMDMADELSKADIPSVMLNPEPLVDNSRVRAAIALLTAIFAPEDSKDMLVFANALHPEDLLTASKRDIEDAIKEVKDWIEDWHKLPNEQAKKKELLEMLEKIDKDDEVYESFLETLKVKSTDKIFEYGRDFYRFGSGAAYRRTHNYPGVVLTTAHSSKGLEWPVVFNMISKYDGRELHSNSRTAKDLEEERKRLLFVSMTRARDELIITGQFVAYGKRGDYTYNAFLKDCYKAVGKDFTSQEVEAMRQARKEAEAAAKKAKKEEKKGA